MVIVLSPLHIEQAHAARLKREGNYTQENIAQNLRKEKRNSCNPKTQDPMPESSLAFLKPMPDKPTSKKSKLARVSIL